MSFTLQRKLHDAQACWLKPAFRLFGLVQAGKFRDWKAVSIICTAITSSSMTINRSMLESVTFDRFYTRKAFCLIRGEAEAL